MFPGALPRAVCAALMLVAAALTAQAQPRLFRILEHDRFGFVDSTGTVVIEPRFDTVGTFADGLAPARLGGSYGYIDERGSFVIAPRYDFALPFSEGRASVFIGDSGVVIDRDGRVVFSIDQDRLGPFEHGLAIITTPNNLMGVVDRNGRRILEPRFHDVRWFGRSRFIVTTEAIGSTGWQWPPPDAPFSNARVLRDVLSGFTFAEPRTEQYFIIDTSGAVVVPRGRFDVIDPPEKELARVLLPHFTDDLTLTEGYIDTAGTLVMQYPVDSNYAGVGYLGGDRWWVGRWLERPVARGPAGWGARKGSRIVDRSGRLIAEDTTLRAIRPFQGSRTFAELQDGRIVLVDHDGRRVCTAVWERDLHYPGFHNGTAFVRMGGLWGTIDTNGAAVILPRFEAIEATRGVEGIFYIRRTVRSGDSSTKLVGIADNHGRVIVEPHAAAYDDRDCGPVLLRMVDSAGTRYVDRRGRIVWRSAGDDVPRPFTIDYRFNISNELPLGRRVPDCIKRNTTAVHIARMLAVPEGDRRSLAAGARPFVVAVRLNRDTIYDALHTGLIVDVMNLGRRAIGVGLSSRHVGLWLEAKDTDGEWRTIDDEEYQYDCAGDDARTTLPAGQMWRFVMPRYDGGMTTRMRFAFAPMGPWPSWRREIIYSEEFDGRVNHAQFWRWRTSGEWEASPTLLFEE